jgi:hypothetical protein
MDSIQDAINEMAHLRNEVARLEQMAAKLGAEYLSRSPKPLQAAIDNLNWTIANTLMQPADGVKIIGMDVWTEGKEKCEDHCWHRIHVKNSHRENLKLGLNDEHYDFTCCRCTHALCHTGPLTGDLIKHPLDKFHPKKGQKSEPGTKKIK